MMSSEGSLYSIMQRWPKLPQTNQSLVELYFPSLVQYVWIRPPVQWALRQEEDRVCGCRALVEP